MKKLKFRTKQFLFACLIAQAFFSNKISAQESIVPLGSNPVLKEAAKKSANNINQRIAASDTLTLPFIDDFSRQGMYPFDSLWLDSSVYINTNYGDLPVTIGVATFDGIDQNGVPHNQASTADTIGDNLTSRPIDIVAQPGDTSVWLSFYYQPAGLGDVPESVDSLVLQFKDTAGIWTNAWSVPGRSDTAFQRVNIHILDAKYFFRGFQFRFYNIATVNGNRDHWNIDYVFLRNLGAENDPIPDNALIYPQTTLLTEFTAMPYPHYKFLGGQIPANMKTLVTDTMYTINYGISSILPAVEINQNGAPVFNANAGSISTGGPLTYTGYSIPLSGFTYPVQSVDSTEFLIKSFYTFTGGAQSNLFNDTSYFTQSFKNYYAYDDGTAEVGYGVTGNTDVQIAYKFDVKMRDTLVGAQIYFNPVGVDVSNTLFQLIAWSNVDVAGNNDTRIRTTYDLKPGVNESINGFKTYIFDTALVVDPGTVYIGIQQNEPSVQYGIGLDRNTDSRSKMFYHIDGFWHQSNVKGSWMIRPIFGTRYPFTIGVGELSNNFEFRIYPNPAQNNFTVELPFAEISKMQVLNVIGEIVLEDELSETKTFTLGNIPSGIYFVRITNEKNLTSLRKLVINN